MYATLNKERVLESVGVNLLAIQCDLIIVVRIKTQSKYQLILNP